MNLTGQLLAVAILLSSVVAGFSQNQGKFMTNVGELKTGDITVTASKEPSVVTLRFQNPGNFHQNTIAMELVDGWFAFVDASRPQVWVFDGVNTLVLRDWSARQTIERRLSLESKEFPVALPAGVLQRVNASLHEKLSAAEAVEGGGLITKFGIYQIGHFTVTADLASRSFKVTEMRSEETGTSETSSLQSNALKEGWFAFVDGNGKHVWMYDGADSLILMEWGPEEAGMTHLNPRRLNKDFRVPVPAVVLERLEN